MSQTRNVHPLWPASLSSSSASAAMKHNANFRRIPPFHTHCHFHFIVIVAPVVLLAPGNSQRCSASRSTANLLNQSKAMMSLTARATAGAKRTVRTALREPRGYSVLRVATEVTAVRSKGGCCKAHAHFKSGDVVFTNSL